MEVKRELSVEDIVRKKVRTSNNDSLGDFIPLNKQSTKRKFIKPLNEQDRKALPIYGVSH